MFVNCIPSLLHAQGLNDNAPSLIKYLGGNNDELLFQMEYDNQTAESFLVIIKDEDGTILFTEKVKGKRFSKKFQFSRAEMGSQKLIFSVVTTKEKQTEVFQVATSTRVVEDVVVTRL
jgi:hypothetical protein